MFRHESPAKERVQAWGRMAKVKVQKPTNKEANSFVTKLNAETACLEDARRDAPPETPRRPRRPAAASKQRKKATGVLVRIWKGCGLDANEVALGLGNTVYLSRDTLGRMHRRITKADIYGETALDSPYDSPRPSCKHEDIHYLPRFRHKNKAEVDAAVLPVSIHQLQNVPSFKQIGSGI